MSVQVNLKKNPKKGTASECETSVSSLRLHEQKQGSEFCEVHVGLLRIGDDKLNRQDNGALCTET